MGRCNYQQISIRFGAVFSFFGVTLRWIDAPAIVATGGLSLVKLAQLSNARGDVHGQQACVVVVGGVEGSDHLLVPREELVVVVMIPAAADEVDSQVLRMVVVVGGGCGRRCCN